MKRPVNERKAEAKWIEGSVQDFLKLSDADMKWTETRLAMSRTKKKQRLAE